MYFVQKSFESVVIFCTSFNSHQNVLYALMFLAELLITLMIDKWLFYSIVLYYLAFLCYKNLSTLLYIHSFIHVFMSAWTCRFPFYSIDSNILLVLLILILRLFQIWLVGNLNIVCVSFWHGSITKGMDISLFSGTSSFSWLTRFFPFPAQESEIPPRSCSSF